MKKNISNITLLDIINNNDVSIRLSNCIKRATDEDFILIKSVGDYIKAGDKAKSIILKMPNMGLKTALELDELIKNIIETGEVNNIESSVDLNDDAKSVTFIQLVEKSYSSERLTTSIILANSKGELPFKNVSEYIKAGSSAVRVIQSLKNIGKKTALELDSLIKEKFSCNENDGVKIEWTSLSSALVDILKKREYEVIERRFGLNSFKPQTLEIVGCKFGVTRERIRQIEVSAKKKLKRPANFDWFKNQLDIKNKEIWKSICDRYNVVHIKIIDDYKNKIPNNVQFLIDIVFDNLTAYLNVVANRTTGGWYLKDIDNSTINNINEKIIKCKEYLSFPRPIVSLLNFIEYDIKNVEITSSLSPDFSIYKGYIFEKSLISPRKRRCVNLHILMSTCFKGGITERDLLLVKYRQTYLKDQCNFRDLEIVMSDNPHLFLNLCEAGWLAIATVVPLYEYGKEIFQQPVKDIKSNAKYYLNNNLEYGEGLVDFVYKMLMDEGPMALNPAKEKFKELAGDRYSENSLFPTLITQSEFSRLAPGVYGTREHLEDIDSVHSISSILLRETQCKIYVMCKFSFPPFIDYPFWTPAMEYEWCQWAEKKAGKELFKSLLSIIQPDLWPVGNNEKQVWIDKKERLGVYTIKDPTPALENKLPSLKDVLIIAFYAMENKYINWLVANRLLGKRIDDQHIVAVLAILEGIDCLKEVDTWQLSHEFNSKGYDVILVLMSCLFYYGDISLIDEVRELLNGEIKNIKGWLNENDLSQLIDSIKIAYDTSKLNKDHKVVKLEPQNTFEELLERKRELEKIEKIQALIDQEDF